MDVLRKMLVGSKSSVRTELATQLEEQGFIPAIFENLKDKTEPVCQEMVVNFGALSEFA